MFDGHTNEIFGYLERLSVQSSQDFDILRQAAGLVGDLMKLYGKRIQTIANLTFVPPLLEVLNQSSQIECKKTVVWCRKVIEDIKNNN